MTLANSGVHSQGEPSMRILCSQKLWRFARAWDIWGTTEPRAASGLLGSWAATRFQEEGVDLVIAISKSTYLTVVFPFREPPGFCVLFREALADALEDLGVPAARVKVELAALEALDFEWLRDSTLRSVLRDLETNCGIELAYHQNLRIVQLNLNEVPHGSLAGHIPSDAVAKLLGSDATPVKRLH